LSVRFQCVRSCWKYGCYVHQRAPTIRYFFCIFKIDQIINDHEWTTNNALLFSEMNCELMLTYDTPALRQTGSRNLMDPKTLLTIWGTYTKLVTKYQISAINSCWEKCDEKCAYMFNVYKNSSSCFGFFLPVPDDTVAG
jgi:hypothetical protein